MNADIERLFIDNFLRKKRGERAQFALLSRKRRNYIWNIKKDIFEERYLRRILPKGCTPLKLIGLLRECVQDEQCYVFSIGQEDGTVLPLDEAINNLYGYGPFILYFPEHNIAFFEEEQSYGSPDRYLLIPQ